MHFTSACAGLSNNNNNLLLNSKVTCYELQFQGMDSAKPLGKNGSESLCIGMARKQDGGSKGCIY